MGFVVVGTAGHVDHGKTVLVKALTGVDTDRLKEEKERGISIELGFAPLTLPNGVRLGLVDVPGHERFIRQMLAGAGGVDVAMLVVAADEGVMPQTREHLDIINLLGVKSGVLVITKCDLVDQDWLEMVKEEVRELVRGTVLEEAPLVSVSAVTGQGLGELISALQEVVSRTEPKPASGVVRMPVDRVFSKAGFGTIVTGTLWSGKIEVGNTLVALPGEREVRVRNIEVHGEKVAQALAGQRVALNLAGAGASTVSRGDVIVTPGSFLATKRLDVELRVLQSAPKPIKNRQRVRFYLGTSEVFGRVVLLDCEQLQPGDTGFSQLEMEEPVVAARNDRFVIRFYSPMITLGGGMVVDPLPPKHKRFDPQVVRGLEVKAKANPGAFVRTILFEAGGPVPIDLLAARTGIDRSKLEELVFALERGGQVRLLSAEGITYVVTGEDLSRLGEEASRVVRAYHEHHPLRPGMPKEELRTKKYHRLHPKAFQALLDEWVRMGFLYQKGSNVALPQFEPRLSENLSSKVKELEKRFLEAGFQPPAWETVCEDLGVPREEINELLLFMLSQRILVKVAEGLYFHKSVLERATSEIIAAIEARGEISLAEVRDILGTSRKYALPFLEYLDQTKVTRRVGDKRVLAGGSRN